MRIALIEDTVTGYRNHIQSVPTTRWSLVASSPFIRRRHNNSGANGAKLSTEWCGSGVMWGHGGLRKSNRQLEETRMGRNFVCVEIEKRAARVVLNL